MDWRAKICVLYLSLLSVTASAQLAWESAYWDALEGLKETPMAVKIWAEDLQSRSIERGDCDSLNLARAVLATVINVNGGETPLEDSWAANTACDTSGYVTWYSLGVHHYLNKRLVEARAAFEQSLVYSPKTARQVSTWHAIGSLSNQLGELEVAYHAFKMAYELEPESNHPLRLNNLATINLSLRDYHTALDWLKLAEEAWVQRDEDLSSKLPEDFGEVILRNRLLCATELGLWQEAEAIFHRLTPGEFDGQDPIAGATIILNYLLRTDRLQVFRNLQGPLSRAFATDSTRAVYNLGVAAMLFEPWRPEGQSVEQAWGEVLQAPGWAWKSPWPDLETGESSAEDGAIEGELGVDPNPRPWAPISYATVLILVGIGGLRARHYLAQNRVRKRKAARAATLTSELLEIQSVAEMLKGQPEDFNAALLPWQVLESGMGADAPSMSDLREKLAENTALTSRELELLYWTLRGVDTEGLAEKLACKKSHIYNLRTSLRTKLDLETDVNWQHWWRTTHLGACLLLGALTSVLGQDVAPGWNSSVAEVAVVTERPDTLGFLPVAATSGWTDVEAWMYHVWAAVALDEEERLAGLSALPDAAPVWLKSFADGGMAFEPLRLTAPRIAEHLQRKAAPPAALEVMKTEKWVAQGTPTEQRRTWMRRVQWGAFVAACIGLLVTGVAAMRRSKSVEDPAVAAGEGGAILTPNEVALNRSIVEQCLAQAHPNSAEVRRAVYATELLALAVRERQASERGRLPGIWPELTQREKQVALLLALRYPPQEIAEMLQCAPTYVYNMKSALRKKWDLATSSDLDRELMGLV